MPFINAQQTRILWGAQPLHAYLRSVTPSATRDMLEVSTLADTSKVFIPGLTEYSLNVDGLFDSTATTGSLLNDITTTLSSSATVATSVAPDGFTAGNSVWLIPSKIVTYEVSSQVADAVGFSAAFGAGTAPALGTSITDLAAVTSTSNSASQDNSTSSANGAVAHLHITAVSGTTPTLAAVVQHSTNNSTWSTLGSFTTASAIGSEVITVTGTVNRYVRVAFTVGGTTPSFTCQVSLARY